MPIEKQVFKIGYQALFCENLMAIALFKFKICILGKVKIKTCLASLFLKKRKEEGLFFFLLRNCSKYPHLVWMIFENGEALFIFYLLSFILFLFFIFLKIFWTVGPSCYHKTTLKCVFWICWVFCLFVLFCFLFLFFVLFCFVLFLFFFLVLFFVFVFVFFFVFLFFFSSRS